MALTRPDHRLLDPADRCFYLGEYTSGAGFNTPTNDLIINLKIPPSELRKNPRRQRWKTAAITEIATALSNQLNGLAAGRIVVPIPTSKVPGHPEHDDRLLRVLSAITVRPQLNVRELIKQRVSTDADHESEDRQDYDDLLRNCYVDESQALPIPTSVILFDDVITEGKHFRVCQHLVHERYGGELPVIGLFVARRIHLAADVDFDVLI